MCFAHPAGYNFDSTAFVPRASRLLLCELRIPRGAFLVSQDAISCERTKVCFAPEPLLCRIASWYTRRGTYFFSASCAVYTPFRPAQSHCPPDNVRPAGGFFFHRTQFPVKEKNTVSQTVHANSCNWLPFYRSCSFASQTFIWFADHSF